MSNLYAKNVRKINKKKLVPKIYLYFYISNKKKILIKGYNFYLTFSNPLIKINFFTMKATN